MLDEIYSHFLTHQLVSTDSRKITPNCIFFALRGENFNGNLYALDALKRGAAFAIVDEDLKSDIDQVLLVPDVLKCLQDFAHRYRHEFDIPVIAITGSNGKTTTKELMATVLSTHFSTHFTKGNLNNHIGVPLTLLQLKEDHRIAVIEMGANHVGEISELCKIVSPTHGLITNIGKAHLEGFGGIEGVKKAKGELFDYLVENRCVAFINQSEPTATDLTKDRALRQVNYSENSARMGFADLKLIKGDASLSIDLQFYNKQSTRLATHLQGVYNIPNLLNAICIGIYFKVSIENIVLAVKSYIPNNNRSQIIKIESNKFLLDAYNANPSSMEAALLNFSALDHSRKIVILGDMYELGDYAYEEHRRIAELATQSGFERVILVGKYFPKANFSDLSSLKIWFQKQKFHDCFFLIKGSRGMALEGLLAES